MKNALIAVMSRRQQLVLVNFNADFKLSDGLVFLRQWRVGAARFHFPADRD